MLKFKTVNEYLASQPPEVRELLQQFRSIIKRAAPQAEEVISYNMPAFRYHGILVYYAGNKHHIGFYPTSSVQEHFKEELKNYETSKGTIKFPYDKPIPVSLVKNIVKFRVKQNLEKENGRSKEVASQRTQRSRGERKVI